jgi:hypothetical protein
MSRRQLRAVDEHMAGKIAGSGRGGEVANFFSCRE